MCGSTSANRTKLLTVGTPCWWECASWGWRACFDILGVSGVALSTNVGGRVSGVTWGLLLRAGERNPRGESVC